MSHLLFKHRVLVENSLDPRADILNFLGTGLDGLFLVCDIRLLLFVEVLEISGQLPHDVVLRLLAH